MHSPLELCTLFSLWLVHYVLQVATYCREWSTPWPGFHTMMSGGNAMCYSMAHTVP